MRALLALALIVLVLAFVGWITFDSSSDSPSATIETEKIEQDIDQLSNTADRVGESLSDSVNGAISNEADTDETNVDVDEEATTETVQ